MLTLEPCWLAGPGLGLFPEDFLLEPGSSGALCRGTRTVLPSASTALLVSPDLIWSLRFWLSLAAEHDEKSTRGDRALFVALLADPLCLFLYDTT